MLRVLIVALLVSVSAHAEPVADPLLNDLDGTWAIGSTSNCARASYELTVSQSVDGALVHFRDRAGQINTERVDKQRRDGGFTSTTIASPTASAGTRWEHASAGNSTIIVRNLGGGQQFALLRCAASAPRVSVASLPPTFSEPLPLVAWLRSHSTYVYGPEKQAGNLNVFSPGLSTAIRGSWLRSQQRNEPPCGMDGDFILATQEGGAPQNLRLSAQPTAPDRVAVAASYDVDGNHRARRFMTVNLNGT